MVLMIINWVDIIDLKNIILQILEKSTLILICHAIIIEDCLLKIYSFWIAQISIAIIKIFTLSKAYKDFKDIFSMENASYLLLHKDHNHIIYFIDSTQPFYKQIHSLSENEFSILWT